MLEGAAVVSGHAIRVVQVLEVDGLHVERLQRTLRAGFRIRDERTVRAALADERAVIEESSTLALKSAPCAPRRPSSSGSTSAGRRCDPARP